jgi:predicted nuclease with TOPRIM domain
MDDATFQALLALGSAIAGGVGVKFIERVTPSKDRQLDDAAQIRQELREENRQLRTEMNAVNVRNDDLVRENAMLAAKADSQQRVIEEQAKRIDELKAMLLEQSQRIERLERRIDNARHPIDGADP